MFIAHTSTASHRGISATAVALAKTFSWSTVRANIEIFVKGCIHCILTTGGKRVPRSLGSVFRGTEPSYLVQYDHIQMRVECTGDRYTFMVLEDHSGYSWFYSTTGMDTEQAALDLLD